MIRRIAQGCMVVSFFGWLACSGSQKPVAGAVGKFEVVNHSTDSLADDSTQYELVVLDARFETFLASVAQPKWYYSQSYYESWNLRYCIEWNQRCTNPALYGTFYETVIPYDAGIDYGLDFNYRLYQYFQFIEQEYGQVLIRRKGR